MGKVKKSSKTKIRDRLVSGNSNDTKHYIPPRSTQNSVQGNMISKRKKRKSTIFKPHKGLRLTKSKSSSSSFKESASDDSNVLTNYLLKPSTSELEPYEISSQSEITSSEISVSLNERKRICSDERTDFPMKKFSSYSTSGSDCDTFNLHSMRSNTDLSNDLGEFFESTTPPHSNLCGGDVYELIYGNSCERDETGMVINGNTSGTNTDEDSDGELNDSVDLGLKYMMEYEENGETSSECSTSDLEVFEVDAKYITVLKYSQTIKIFGYCDLKVLFGKVNVLGFTLTSKLPEHSIYSPRGSALLTLKNTSKFCDEVRTVKTLVPQLAKCSAINDLTVRKDCSILMFSKSTSFKLNLIEDHISQKIIPNRNNLPCVDIEPKGSWNTIAIPQEWDNIIVNSLNGTSKLFICGGKGVGKSTFLRYAVNCLLMKYGEVKIVDLDPGQSEFTVPGTLSLVTVTKPLLGINYTHLKEADRSILCDINVSKDPHKYVQCIEELIKTEESASDNVFPIIINFMGYTNYMAFHLLSSAIAILQPDNIVYIHSTHKKKNFKIKMNRETIAEHSKLFCPNLSMDFEMKILRIPAATDENLAWTLEPRQMREMCILAYFGQSMDETTNSLQSYKLPTFEVDLLDVLITDKNNVKVETDAINGNIVALCALVNEKSPIFQCFGWGIVRGIERSSRKVIIITPITEDLLNKVTHLVAGSLSLPPSVYMNHENVQDAIPYVIEGELIEFAQMSKRTHIPVTRK